MPVVNIPNVGSVNFPDTMSPEDITKAIENDILKTSKAEVPKTMSAGEAAEKSILGSYLSLSRALGGASPETAAKAKEEEQRAAEEHPVASTLGKLGAYVAPMGAMAPLAVPASAAGIPTATMLAGGGTGLAEGAGLTGLGGTGVGVATGAATAPFVGTMQGAERYQELLNAGVPEDEARKAAITEGIIGGGANIIPTAGAGLLGRFAQGAGINVGAGMASRGIQNVMANDPRVKQDILDPKQMLLEATIGGVTEGIGGNRVGDTFFAKDVPSTPKVDPDIADFKVRREFTGQGELPLENTTRDVNIPEGNQKNIFGFRPSDLEVDENGMPILRQKSAEAATPFQRDIFEGQETPTPKVKEEIPVEKQPEQVTFKYETEGGQTIEETGSVIERNGTQYIRWQDGTLENGKPTYRMIELEKAKDVLPVKEPEVDVATTARSEYDQKILQQFPDATKEELDAGWQAKQERMADETKRSAIISAFSGSPKLQKVLAAYDTPTLEKAVQAIADSSDDAKISVSGKWLFSRGRIGIERIKNQGLKSGLSYMMGLRDDNRIIANRILNDPGKGLINKLTKLESLFSVERAAEVLRQRQEAQFNPNYKYNLDPDQMDILKQMDSIFEDIRKQMEQITGKPVKKIDNYFPSMFYGPFAVKIVDDSGRTIAFVTEKDKQSASAAAEWVMKDFNDRLIKEGKSPVKLSASEPLFRRDIQSPAFRNRAGLAPHFEAMMDLLGSEDDLVKRAQDSVQNLVAKRAMDTRKFSQRFEKKIGVEGAQGKQGWKSAKENYYDAKEVLENYITAFYDWKANMESSAFLDKVKTDMPDKANIHHALSTYFDDMIGKERGPLNQMGDDVATWMANTFGKDVMGGMNKTAKHTASALTKAWLGFWNPVAMAQNVLQPANVLPKLVELATSGGGSKDVMSPMLTGSAQALRDLWEIAGGKMTGKELSETARYLIENEIIKPGLVETGQGSTARVLGKGAGAVDKYIISGGLLTTEAFARATTFNIFLKYLQNSGYDINEARTVAKNLTHEYMVNYEDYAKSGVFAKTGALGELAGRLQSYKMNQLTQLRNYFDVALKDKNPLPLLTALALSATMAGVTGMIGMDIVEGIYGGLVNMGVIDPKNRSPRQWALDLGGAAAVGVPSQLTGKWLSGSLSSQLVGDMSWKSLAPVIFGTIETAGKVPTLVESAVGRATGKRTVPLSEEAGALQALSPAIARGYIEQGMLTDKEGRMVSPYTGQVTYQQKPGEAGILEKFTNVRPVQRGEASLRKTLLSNQEKRIDEKRADKTQRLQKLYDESVRMNRPINSEVIGKYFNDIIALEGDPANTLKSIENFIKKNQLGDWFQQQYMSGNVTISNVAQKMRALDQKRRLEER